MAKRVRDYRAEYAARQAKSKEQYGVTYNQQRRLITQAGKTSKALTPAEVRSTLKTLKDRGATNPGKIVDLRIKQIAGKHAKWLIRDTGLSDGGEFDGDGDYEFDPEWSWYHNAD